MPDMTATGQLHWSWWVHVGLLCTPGACCPVERHGPPLDFFFNLWSRVLQGLCLHVSAVSSRRTWTSLCGSRVPRWKVDVEGPKLKTSLWSKPATWTVQFQESRNRLYLQEGGMANVSLRSIGVLIGRWLLAPHQAAFANDLH